MGNVVSTFKRANRYDHDPLVVSVGSELVYIDVVWERSSANEIQLSVRARDQVDVLIPSTFKKLKQRIKELEYQLEMVKCSTPK